MTSLTGGSGAVFIEIKRKKAGDTILELHLNNDWFREKHKLGLTTARLASDMLVSFTHDLRIIAKEMDSGIFSNCAALHGCTHIGAIAKRLGFQVDELPNSLWKRFARFYIYGLIQAYGSPNSKETIELEEVWFSKRELLRRYG
jgi:hypothetical protein